MLIDRFQKTAEKYGLEYMLIGGFAVSFWGSPRFTADVNFVVRLDSLDKVTEIVKELGYELVFYIRRKALLILKKRPIGF